MNRWPKRSAKSKGRRGKGTRRGLLPLAWSSLAIGLVAWVAVAAVWADTVVVLNVWPGEPNDPNDPNDVFEMDGGEQVSYFITASVEPDDPNETSGLGALYVTLRTNFVDPNLVGGPSEIHETLGLYPSTGLMFDDNITDIGGSQDLIGDGNAVEFANGETVVIAAGTVTVPSQDGTYHVWATPESVSVLEPDLSEGPTGRPADGVGIGQGFYIVVGDSNYHTLEVEENDPTRGTAYKDPDLRLYPEGLAVTLTGIPYGNKEFKHWRHFDPNDGLDANDANYGDDPNYYETDFNNPTVVIMDQDHQVLAWFKCGSGMIVMLMVMCLGPCRT